MSDRHTGKKTHGPVHAAEPGARDFYLALLGIYVTLRDDREQFRKTLADRGEQVHLRLTQQVKDWQKQVREVIARRLQ